MGIAAVILIAVAVVVLGFRVRTIDVYGNDRHSSEEISSGLVNDFLSKNTLFLMWKYKDGEVPDTLPFLNSLQLQMQSPSHIEAVVEEKELVAYIDKGQYVGFDKSGIVMQMTDGAYSDIPIITGVDTEEPVLYKKLPTQSSAQLRTILSLTQLLAYHEMTAQEIRFSESMEITVYMGSIEVMLGQDEYLEEKVANLKSILGKMEEGQSGVLHLESFTGSAESVTFTPIENVAAETEAAEDGTGAEEDAAEGMTDDTAAEGMADGTAAEDVTDDAAADDTAEDTSSGGEPFMAFDSSGTLRYDVRVVNGEAVDSSGNPVPGCSVNEYGYVVDAYMNVIDPATGQPIQ